MAEKNRSVVEIIDQNAPDTGTLTGALLALLPVVPIIATLFSIITFIAQKSQLPVQVNPGWPEAGIPLLVGVSGAFILWVGCAFLGRPFTSVDKVHSNSYYGLLDHLTSLNAFIDARVSEGVRSQMLAMPGQSTIGSSLPSRQILSAKIADQQLTPGDDGSAEGDPALMQLPAALREVVYCRNAICLALMKRSFVWILSKRYTELWDLMDRAEEACLSIAPCENVVSEAAYDEMRLNDSNIENSVEWINKLRSAVQDLDAEAVRYLKPATGLGFEHSMHASLNYQASLTTAGLAPGESGTQRQQRAEAVNGKLPQVESGVATLSRPESAQAAPLPEIANPTTASKAAGDTHDATTAQDVLAENPNQIQARAILRKVRQTINRFDTRSWDGLVNARNQLLATMLLVGMSTFFFVEIAILMQVKLSHIIVATVIAFIGALAGLIGRLSIESQAGTAIDDYHLSLARLLVTPLLSGLAAVIGVLFVAKTTSLDTIYSFAGIVPNLIIAATFGLTPNLLINQLQKKADTYKGNLQSTTAASGK